MEVKFNQVKNSLTNNPISPELFEDVYSQITLILEDADFKDKELCINDLNNLFHIIKLNNDEHVRYSTVFNALVESEYGTSLNRFSDAHIKFHGHYVGVEFKQDIKIGDEKSETSISKDFLNYFNFQNVIYIDSPLILENNRCSSQYYLQMLERKLKKIKRTDDVYGDEFYKDLNGIKNRYDDEILCNLKIKPSDSLFLTLPKIYKGYCEKIGFVYNKEEFLSWLLKVPKRLYVIFLNDVYESERNESKSYKYKKTFKAKTNKKGVATFTIKKSVYKKLKTNKKYTYQVTYLKSTVKKTIRFK